MGQKATVAELQTKDRWLQDFVTAPAGSLPFSFRYGGEPSASLFGSWSKQSESARLDEGRTRHTLTWTDAATGLEVRCVAVDYADFPVVEWTLYFTNTGAATSPILEQIRAVDLRVARQGDGDFLLHHNRGDTCGPDAYEPLQQPIAAATEHRFAPIGGRPTSLAFPYFNLQDGNAGAIIALGWPGQWSAHFACDDRGNLRIGGGQELTHFRLFPGEEARSPLAVLMFWQGDLLASQNLWRRWMFDHNLPRRQGKLFPNVSAMCAGVQQDEAGEKGYIDALVRNRVGLDYWWMDAGWYPGTPGPKGDWMQVGTWEPDPERFPGGIKAVAAHAHERNMKLVLWFELERVSPGSAWSGHTDWLLAVRPEDRHFRRGGTIGTPEFTIEEANRNQIKEGDRLFNLGHPEALEFLVEYVSPCIAQWGIDLFRLDFNISPLLFWRAADAPDRQGIAENRYVCGLLRFFDALLQRHPGLTIDSCASGGRRIDIETMRRTVVNTRSDYWCVSPTGDQCQTHGIASWIPQYFCASSFQDTYRYHSNLAPGVGFGDELSSGQEVDWHLFRRRLAAWQRLAPLFSGDYYPLTPWSSREDAWLAWQFYRPEHGDGLVQLFRRSDNEEPENTVRLHGLDARAHYDLVDLETGTATRISGEQLLGRGLRVEIPDRRGSLVLSMTKVRPV